MSDPCPSRHPSLPATCDKQSGHDDLCYDDGLGVSWSFSNRYRDTDAEVAAAIATVEAKYRGAVVLHASRAQAQDEYDAMAADMIAKMVTNGGEFAADAIASHLRWADLEGSKRARRAERKRWRTLVQALVDTMPRCSDADCDDIATRRDGDPVCDQHGEHGIVLAYTAPLRTLIAAVEAE